MAGNYQQKWTRDRRGNAQTTVWMEAKTDSKGGAYWSGVLSLKDGRKLGFIVNGTTINAQRGNKDVQLTPLKITVLPKVDAPSIGL